jgi:hypothetical protein
MPELAEPPPPADYTRQIIFHLRSDVLGWLVPACLTAVFLLSFFPWHTTPLALWQLAFTSDGSGLFLTYTLLTMFLAWPLSIVSLLLDRRLIPLPPALRPLLPWKTLLIVSILAAGIIPVGFDYLQQHFYTSVNHIAIAMKLGVRFHLLAFVIALVDFWLQDRQRRYQPLPRIEMHW